MTEPPTSSADLTAPRARDELLATKVNIPRTRPDRLARARLFQRLDEGMARALALVCTPAGFGKTTLLAHWATNTNRAVAWLSLDPDHNDPARFWRYVVAALDRAREGLGEQLRPLLTAPTPLSGHGVVTALINQFQAQPDELALVLDDYHVIEEAAIHDSLGFLLRHLPPQLHLVVSSRSDPPLPLARLRASGQLTELRAADLRFTPEEAAAFLQEVWKLDLSAQTVAALERVAKAGQPVVDGGDLDDGFVADGEFVVSGGEGAVAFESVDAALDSVSLLVVHRAEHGRSASPAALVLAMADLVGLERDRAADTASAQVGAVGAGPVCLVGADPGGASSRMSRPDAGHTDLLQDGAGTEASPLAARR